MNSEVTFTAKVRVSLDANAMPDRVGWRSGIRPNHRIPGRDHEMFIGTLTFSDREWLRPGECADATGSFMVMPADVPLFVPGFSWELCEGKSTVGTAEFLERKDA